MKRFSIIRTEENCKFSKNTQFKKGYSFSQKLKINVYNEGIISFILKKKMENSIDKLFSLFYLLDDDEDDSVTSELLAKIETLKILLYDKYQKYLTDEEIKLYEYKLEKMEGKIKFKKIKKRRH